MCILARACVRPNDYLNEFELVDKEPQYNEEHRPNDF